MESTDVAVNRIAKELENPSLAEEAGKIPGGLEPTTELELDKGGAGESCVTSWLEGEVIIADCVEAVQSP